MFFDPGPPYRLKADTLITYKEWKKEKKTVERKSKKNDDISVEKRSYRSIRAVCTTSLSRVMKKFLEDIQELKQNTERKISQFRKIKAVRAEISDPANKAVMARMDRS